MAAGIAGGAIGVCAQQATPRILFGMCAGLDKAAKLKEIGYDYIEGGVAGFLKPDVSDAEFAPELEKLKTCVLPIRSLTGFLPGKFRLTGPGVNHETVLEYAVTACKRASAAGIPIIVLGSGAARKLPEGFDPEQGKAQFIAFCRQLGGRIRDCNVTIVLEPLNKEETNILNRVSEGIDYVDAIHLPNIQLLADIFHMLKEREGPDSIRKAGARLRHCHIAELEGRKAPGTKGEDFRGFFTALREVGYAGGVSCECGWPKTDVERAWAKTLATLREQSGG